MGEVWFNPIVLCFLSLESSPRGFSPLGVSALLGAVSVGGSRRRPLLSPLSPQLKSPETVILHATREEKQASSGTLRWHESGKSFNEEHLVSLYSPEY
ncbi:hypothetical protein DY000_02021315 [Brassica cretica]|uniref:Ig-like domain-containing protein n=1 Tax=Brassica cretica TaxID=69181 RepID=A0ABQ7EAY6_BRACR|nr:hypothetical protein DY000_02021315 [Brassica cretica]